MRSIQSDEKEHVRQIYHRDAHYHVITSHKTSVRMIGHLELAIGTLTSHVSLAWLTKFSPGSQSDFSQMPPSRSGSDCERRLCNKQIF